MNNKKFFNFISVVLVICYIISFFYLLILIVGEPKIEYIASLVALVIVAGCFCSFVNCLNSLEEQVTKLKKDVAWCSKEISNLKDANK